ncbi:MAG: hypothetical protein Fur0037_04280 [Planctomycetota bacterium]
MIFRKQYRYRFGDIDHAGIAYYPALLHYFHCGFEDWWSDGLAAPYPQVMRDENLGLPAVKLEVEFFAPLRYGDEPWFHLGVLGIGESSVRFGFWFDSESDGRTLCRARVTTVAVFLDSLQKRPVPERWRERFARFAIEEREFPGPRGPARDPCGQPGGNGRKARGK